ncbi:hypothetical protein V6N12_031145 [Hibiscus sabdariffa]|uniref:Uncharacterized protein n=1 Tax=Hibiscus sabdariffa TaxID=183260 RepID=A0ABR2E840_9ROSI
MERSQVNVSGFAHAITGEGFAGGLNGRPLDGSTFSAPADDSATHDDFIVVVIPSSRERLGSPLSPSAGRVQKKSKEDDSTNMDIIVMVVVDCNTDPRLINVGSQSTAGTMPVANRAKPFHKVSFRDVLAGKTISDIPYTPVTGEIDRVSVMENEDNIAAERVAQALDAPSATPETQQQPHYGPWMHVKQRGSRVSKVSREPGRTVTAPIIWSRFSALSVEQIPELDNAGNSNVSASGLEVPKGAVLLLEKEEVANASTWITCKEIIAVPSHVSPRAGVSTMTQPCKLGATTSTGVALAPNPITASLSQVRPFGPLQEVLSSIKGR